MNASVPPLRIFLSSTAEDLAVHRQKVSEAVLRLEHFPVSMELFPAAPGAPADECRARAAAADAVLVLLAHRYGSVPSPEEGGDGERSFTWLEVQAAQDAGKPVFAFLVDRNAPWDQPRESSALDEDPDRSEEITARVRRLQAFRAWLSSTFTCSTFSTPEDLALKVSATLATFARSGTAQPPPPAREWRPLVIHPLQPARYFHGRDALVAELVEWVQAPAGGDRVVSLVAAGGTGKTALAERVVARAPAPAGLLVWSFYEDHRTEEFLRAACEYFTGAAGTPVGERLERLQNAFSEDRPHLLVLDGLERVQGEGHDGRPRGTVEDSQLRRLLRFMATPQCRARALLTSRYPVVDLEPWDGAGYRSVPLEDLDVASGRAVLRGWGVRGRNAALDALVRQVHGHALTVAVLGSYLGNFCQGDPSRAPTFDRREAAENDLKAYRLARVLDEYADALDPGERALLARLAAFPRGVNFTVISYLLDAGGRVAGGLAGLDEPRVAPLLVRLRNLGLVFAYRVGQDTSYTAHPFLREYFEGLLDVQPREIHEVVRARLAPRLVTRPNQLPVDESALDSYERLIEHTRLAGRTREALDLYWNGLGGYNHLGKWLGENARGYRIVMAFSPDGSVENAARSLHGKERRPLLDDWGLYAKNLGELATARAAFSAGLELWSRYEDPGNRSALLQNLTDIEILAGRFVSARGVAERALAEADAAGDPAQQTQAHAFVASALALLGDVKGARSHFEKAGGSQARGMELLKRFQTTWSSKHVPAYGGDDLLYSVPGVLEAEFHLMCGNAAAAERQLQITRARSQDERSRRTARVCDALLGHVALLGGDTRAARDYLDAAMAFARESSVVEIELRSLVLAAELERRVRDLSAARMKAETGLRLADGSGFGRYSIELRLALARIELDAGDPRQALVRAHEALERAAAPGCRYVWAEGDALDLAGRAHLLLGERDAARPVLAAAAGIRSRLAHPALDETRAALAGLDGG